MSYPTERIKVGDRVQVEMVDPIQLDALTYTAHFTADNMKILQNLYEELQLNCVEAGHPEQDLITFAHRTEYFGIICQKKPPAPSGTETHMRELPTNPYPQVPPYYYQPAKNIDEKSRERQHDEELDQGLYDGLYHGLEKRQNKSDKEWDDFIWNTLPPARPSDREDSSNASLLPSGSSLVQEYIPSSRPKGFVFLMSTQQAPFPPTTVGELTVGIILSADQRGWGYAKEALQLVLEIAFDDLRCHRVQANVLDTYCKDRVINLFTQTRFGHEGTRRRSYYSIMEQEWKDITSFAILDTEYMMRSYFKSAPKTLWDEMLQRHEREREALLRWDHVYLQRTLSTETLRNLEAMTPVGTTSQSENEASESDASGWSSPVFIGKGKRKLGDPTPSSPASSRSKSPSWSEASSRVSQSPGFGSGRKFRKLRSTSVVPDSDMESDDGHGQESHLFHSPPPEVPPSPSAFSGAESDAESDWSAQTTSDWDLLESASNSESER